MHADTLYVIGGLYGNVPALEAVLELAAREPAPVTLVFNGDFNWFNIDDVTFAAVNREVLRHPALRGNVETEMAGDDVAVGCGCAYPESVGDAEVERSNEIIARLRHSARQHTALRARLAALPMHRVAEVGGVRIAIVHGDLESLAGWTLSQESLARESVINSFKKQILETSCSIVVSSHTCLPVALAFDSGHGPCAIFNNGAAGMPNFRDALFGVITRIATTPARHCAPLYGTRIGEVYVDALPVHYDPVRWQSEFLCNWPAGSAAHRSYGLRMTCGPAYAIHQADRLAAGIPGAAQPTVVA